MTNDKPLADAAKRLRGKPGRPRKPRREVDPVVLPPRVLGVSDSGRYISVCDSIVRILYHNGTLQRVRIPLPNGGEVRKLLFDVRDLDALVERWKEDRQ